VCSNSGGDLFDPQLSPSLQSSPLRKDGAVAAECASRWRACLYAYWRPAVVLREARGFSTALPAASCFMSVSA
jgi:hypothetical protein